MRLSDKIEEIRRKPEYIRIRYVWGSVAVCMFFILMLWVFSVKENFRNISKDDVPLTDLPEQVQEETKDLPSIKDTVNKSREELNKLKDEDLSREIQEPKEQSQQPAVIPERQQATEDRPAPDVPTGN